MILNEVKSDFEFFYTDVPSKGQRKPSGVGAGLRDQEHILAKQIFLQNEMQIVYIDWIGDVEQLFRPG